MMRFAHPNRPPSNGRKNIHTISYEVFENKKMSVMVHSSNIPVSDDTSINMADNFAWITDHVEEKPGASAYRDTDRFVVIQPKGRVIGRYYHVTDFKKTIICKLIGCNAHKFPGFCHNGNDSWAMGVFCTRCGNARYWSKLPPPPKPTNENVKPTPAPSSGRLVIA